MGLAPLCIVKRFAICLLISSAAFAQSHFTGFVGGGFSEPVNPIGSRTDNGWNVAAGVGVAGNHVGLMLDFMFNNLPINQASLAEVSAPNGNVRVWGFTLDPVLHVTRRGPADFYITGGGGIYHRTVEFTQPTVSSVTFFDPWFGFYPALIPTNQVIGSFGQYKGGVDGGAGVSVKLTRGEGGLKAFAEARYHHIFTRQVETGVLPVTFGLRW